MASHHRGAEIDQAIPVRLDELDVDLTPTNRSMNSSTAWLAFAKRRSLVAQRIAWRMPVAESCGIMREHSRAERLVQCAMMPA